MVIISALVVYVTAWVRVLIIVLVFVGRLVNCGHIIEQFSS